MTITVSHVKSARKAQGACEACGQPISAGQAYKHWSAFRGPKHARHEDCPNWKPSEMANGPIASAYAAQENAHDALDALILVDHGDANDFTTSVTNILSECASDASEVYDEIEGARSELPENFQDSGPGEAMQEKMDALESWQSDLEGWSPEAEEPDGVPFEDGGEEWEAWAEAILDEARGLVDGLEA